MISKTIGFRGTNHFQTHPYIMYLLAEKTYSLSSLPLSTYCITCRIHTVRDMPLEVCIRCSHGKITQLKENPLSSMVSSLADAESFPPNRTILECGYLLYTVYIYTHTYTTHIHIIYIYIYTDTCVYIYNYLYILMHRGRTSGRT